MVVGRAVNGWGGGFEMSALATEESRSGLSGAPTWNGCPLGWVTESWGINDKKRKKYNPARSAFWRVIRAVAADLEIDGPKWSSRLAWSNLYKVSPAHGGNPSGRLCRAQRAACIELLWGEIETLAPRRILVLTGWNWFGEMADGLGFAADTTSVGQLVDASLKKSVRTDTQSSGAGRRLSTGMGCTRRARTSRTRRGDRGTDGEGPAYSWMCPSRLSPMNLS